MQRVAGFTGGMLAVALGLAGCGNATTAAHTSRETSASTAPVTNLRTYPSGTQAHTLVHITVQQGQGHLTVHITTPGVSGHQAAQLHSAVQQLNQLLQQLQNP